MANSSWKKKPLSNDYNNAANWSNGAPTTDGYIAQFGASQKTAIAVTSGIQVGAWVFAKQAPHYVFTAGAGNYIEFFATGIVNGGGVRIISHYDLEFLNSSSAGAVKITNFGAVLFTNSAKAGHAIIDNRADLNFFGVSSADHARIENKETVSFHADSTAGNAVITNRGDINLFDHSTAGHAHIDNKPSSTMDFFANSTAGSAAITTRSGAMLSFEENSDGGNARLITKAGGTVDVSLTAGNGDDNIIHVGSIEGAGTYNLGNNVLRVGSNNRSTTVTGLIQGESVGSLDKIGKGALTLAHKDNSFAGGTVIEKGTLVLAAVGAAGPGAIVFGDFSQTLKILNKAMPGGHVTNPIVNFGNGDVIDLPGLKFVHGAKVSYHDDAWVVKSGHAKITLDDFNPIAFDFKVKSDGHGGTKIVGVAQYAKSAAHHADGFAFNSEVAHHNDRPSPETGAHHSNHLANAGPQESVLTGILDAVPPVHAELLDLLHHGDFFR